MGKTGLSFATKISFAWKLFIVFVAMALLMPGKALASRYIQEVVTNGNFELGSLDGWTATGDAIVVTAGTDPVTNNSMEMVAEGNYSARIGDEIPWGAGGPQESTLAQELIVPTSNTKGQVLQFVYAVVANDPPDHTEQDKPRFRMVVEDTTNGKILQDTNYIYTSQTSGDWYLGQGAPGSAINQPFYMASGDRWVFRPWQQVQIPLDGLAGHRLRIRFEVRDCLPSAHPIYGYLDGVQIGQPTTITLPPLQGDPQPAVFVDPPFYSGLLLWIEQSKALWLCLCLPLLLLLLLPLLWLLLRRKQPQYVTESSVYRHSPGGNATPTPQFGAKKDFGDKKK